VQIQEAARRSSYGSWSSVGDEDIFSSDDSVSIGPPPYDSKGRKSKTIIRHKEGT